MYSIIDEHDSRRHREPTDEVRQPRDVEARREVGEHEYTHSFETMDELRDYINDL